MIEGGLAVMIEQRRGGGDDRERGRVKVMVEKREGSGGDDREREERQW
jgi:hypothetical protein